MPRKAKCHFHVLSFSPNSQNIGQLFAESLIVHVLQPVVFPYCYSDCNYSTAYSVFSPSLLHCFQADFTATIWYVYTCSLSIFISYSYSFQWSPFKCLWEKRSVHFPYHIPSIQQALTTYFLSFQLATSKWPKHNWGSHVGISSNSNTIVPVLFL